MFRAICSGVMLGVFGLGLAVSSWATGEVNVQAQIKYVPDAISINTSVKKFNQAGSLTSMGRQLINTGAWESVVINGFTNGWAFFRNDDTNSLAYIELATAGATNVFIRLDVNEFALFPLSTNGILARCTTSTNAVSGQILKKFNIEE